MDFSVIRTALILALAASVTACGGSSGDSGDSGQTPVTPATVSDDEVNNPPVTTTNDPDPIAYGAPDICTSAGLNEWVDGRFKDDYRFYDQVPIVNPSDYATPADLVADLRVSPDEFSSIFQIRNFDFLEPGESFGWGFVSGIASDGTLRMIDVQGNSPIDRAGILRGDRIIAVNNIPTDTLTPATFNELLGPIDGVSRTLLWTVSTDNEPARDVLVTTGVFIFNPVAPARVTSFNNSAVRIGYLDLATFSTASSDKLTSEITFLRDEEITDLVLDLRYNPGGRVDVARKFASQLLGPAFTDDVFLKLTYNDKYAEDNLSLLFTPQNANLSVPRIFVLTTEWTASASEAIANSLSPYVDVVVIGKRTASTNSVDESVLGGLQPTCEVDDDWLHPKYDRRDPLINAARNVIFRGTCPASNLAADPIVDLRAETSERQNHRVPVTDGLILMD